MMARGTWLKRFIVGLIAAIAALFVTRKKVAAPGGGSEAEYKLPPVPDARASGPEDATPLTEEEQAMMARRTPEFKGFSVSESDESAGIAESGENVPPPISYEIAKENADAADALREAGDEAAADALDQRIYFAAPPTEETAGEPDPGDTTPEPTSEAFDVVTDGADHTGQEAAEIEDPTEVGLDIDVDLDDDDPVVPELTSESFDTGEETLGIAAGGDAEASAAGYITVPDEQTTCPDEFPIKGNASSRIYHKPGESSYEATNPEICFATDEVAVSMGYRPRKR